MIPPVAGANPVGVGDDEIKWTDQLAYELHKPVRKHFPKRRVWAKGIDQIWAVDLIDMQHYAKYNDGYKYLLAVIDVFSKYGWMRALKSKTGLEVANVLKDIIKEGRRPE